MKHLIIFFLVILSISTQAQSDCGFYFDNYDLSMNNGSRYADFESNYQTDFADNDPTYGSNYTIPVAVHVLHNGGVENISDEQIIDGIIQVNGFLGENQSSFETGIRLELSCIKRIQVEETTFPGSATVGGWRDISFLDRERFLNLYIIPAFDSPSLFGVASHPVQGADGTIGGQGAPLGDGVAVIHNSVGSMGTANLIDKTVLVHEVGHYLGMYHIFGLNLFMCNDNCADQTKREDWISFGDRIGDTTPSAGNGSQGWCNIPKLDPCVGFCSNAVATGDFFPSDNIMSGFADCKSTFSEGQAKRMKFTLENYRQGLWNTSSELTLNSDFTFSSAEHFVGNLKIEGGATVTIPENAIVRFGENNYVNISQGSRLVLNGTLTSLCDETWKGVEVNGIGSGLYATGGMIENAQLAVILLNGGYSSLISSMLINNKRGMYAHSSSNGAKIEDCAFEVNQDFNEIDFLYHIRMTSNENQVKIRGGYFTNTWDEGSGSAINSYNGNFTVAPSYDYDKFGDLQGTNKVRFNGFNRAIDASNGITFSYQVENSIFDNNNIAIYNNEVNATKITFNEIKMEEDQVGIMYHGSTLGMINQENDFIGFDDDKTVGVLCKDIGVINNTIRRNTFDNLENGCLANGLNGENPQVPRGLTFLCNTNQNVIIDHGIANSSPTLPDQVRPVQGDFVSNTQINATGNIIHYNSNITGSDFFNAGDLEIEYHSRDIISEKLTSSLGVTEIIQPNQNYNCDQNTFIDFPPIIVDPQDPHFPTDLIGMKEYLDSITGGPGTGGPNVGPDITFEQEEWDYFLPFVLNEVMVMNQDYGYYNFSNPNQLQLTSHNLNVVSWIYGNSLEADLTIVRILSENGQHTDALNYLNTLNANWSNHPQVASAIADYNDILNEIGPSRVDNLTNTTVDNIVNDYSIIRTGYGEAWIRSIAQLYDIHIPISYTLPLSGQVSPRNNDPNQSSRLWPNPFAKSFTFKASTSGTLVIFDFLGNEIKKVNLDKGEFEIELENELPGIYFYKFKMGNLIESSGKLIKI